MFITSFFFILVIIVSILLFNTFDNPKTYFGDFNISDIVCMLSFGGDLVFLKSSRFICTFPYFEPILSGLVVKSLDIINYDFYSSYAVKV